VEFHDPNHSAMMKGSLMTGSLNLMIGVCKKISEDLCGCFIIRVIGGLNQLVSIDCAADVVICFLGCRRDSVPEQQPTAARRCPARRNSGAFVFPPVFPSRSKLTNFFINPIPTSFFILVKPFSFHKQGSTKSRNPEYSAFNLTISLNQMPCTILLRSHFDKHMDRQA